MDLTFPATQVLLPTRRKVGGILNKYKTYMDFLGTDDPLQLRPNTDGWIPIAKDIRGKLGAKAYLLDNYLGFVFEGLHHVSARDAAEDGDNASTLLWNAIRYVMTGDEEQGNKNPLYQQAKEYVDAHPLPYREELTQHNIYYIVLANILPIHQLPQYLHRVRPPVAKMDIVRLRELYREIGMLLGDFDPMEQLGESIQASFQVTDASHIYMQGTVEALLYSLTYRDNETSKQVFQLMLEQSPEKESNTEAE